MPFKVRLKLAVICILGVWLNLWLWSLDAWLGGFTFLAAIFYIEMIYPKWNFFGHAVLNVKDKGERAVALTFDDGPSEWTTPILDTLKAEGVKATFFLLGSNIKRHPEIARRIQSEGHVIGFHGETHSKFHLKSLSFIQNVRWRSFKMRLHYTEKFALEISLSDFKGTIYKEWGNARRSNLENFGICRFWNCS